MASAGAMAAGNVGWPWCLAIWVQSVFARQEMADSPLTDSEKCVHTMEMPVTLDAMCVCSWRSCFSFSGIFSFLLWLVIVAGHLRRKLQIVWVPVGNCSRNYMPIHCVSKSTSGWKYTISIAGAILRQFRRASLVYRTCTSRLELQHGWIPWGHACLGWRRWWLSGFGQGGACVGGGCMTGVLSIQANG